MNLGWTQDHGAIAGKVVPLRIPDEKTIPNGPLGAAIRYGKKVLTETRTYAKGYVGNGLNCSSCHLEAGPEGLRFTVGRGLGCVSRVSKPQWEGQCTSGPRQRLL